MKINVFAAAISAAMKYQAAENVLKRMLTESFGGEITPLYTDGDLVGYQLRNVVPGMVWDANGFMEGDILLFHPDEFSPLETPEDIINMMAGGAYAFCVVRWHPPFFKTMDADQPGDTTKWNGSN